MKKVFLSADDFGRSPSRNRAIDESFKKGWIKSTGLIVTGQYLQDAVDYINNGDYVNRVHIHFNLSGNIKDEKDAPLSNRMKKDKMFCENGLFRSFVRIPKSFKTIFKFAIVYNELVAQYNKFIEVTGGRGNRNHVDFHLWYNLTWSVAVALNIFTWTHHIKSVRYIGIHHEHNKRRLYRIVKKLSWNPFVKSYHSSNIDGFLSMPGWFKDFNTFELYCHPDIIKEEVIDNTVSYFGNEKHTMEENFNKLKQNDELKLVSWADDCK